MKVDWTIISHYISQSFSSWMVGRICIMSLGLKGLIWTEKRGSEKVTRIELSLLIPYHRSFHQVPKNLIHNRLPLWLTKNKASITCPLNTLDDIKLGALPIWSKFKEILCTWFIPLVPEIFAKQQRKYLVMVVLNLTSMQLAAVKYVTWVITLLRLPYTFA